MSLKKNKSKKKNKSSKKKIRRLSDSSSSEIFSSSDFSSSSDRYFAPILTNQQLASFGLGGYPDVNKIKNDILKDLQAINETTIKNVMIKNKHLIDCCDDNYIRNIVQDEVSKFFKNFNEEKKKIGDIKPKLSQKPKLHQEQKIPNLQFLNLNQGFTKPPQQTHLIPSITRKIPEKIAPRPYLAPSFVSHVEKKDELKIAKKDSPREDFLEKQQTFQHPPKQENIVSQPEKPLVSQIDKPEDKQQKKPEDKQQKKPLVSQIEKPEDKQQKKPEDKQQKKPLVSQIDKPEDKQQKKPLVSQIDKPEDKQQKKPLVSQIEKPEDKQQKKPLVSQIDKPEYKPLFSKVDKQKRKPENKEQPISNDLPFNKDKVCNINDLIRKYNRDVEEKAIEFNDKYKKLLEKVNNEQQKKEIIDKIKELEEKKNKIINDNKLYPKEEEIKSHYECALKNTILSKILENFNNKYDFELKYYKSLYLY